MERVRERDLSLSPSRERYPSLSPYLEKEKNTFLSQNKGTFTAKVYKRTLLQPEREDTLYQRLRLIKAISTVLSKSFVEI